MIFRVIFRTSLKAKEESVVKNESEVGYSIANESLSGTLDLGCLNMRGPH